MQQILMLLSHSCHGAGKSQGESRKVVRTLIASQAPQKIITYFEALDLITTCISNRFDQPGYKMYRNIRQLKTARNEQCQAEFDCVSDFYGSDLNPYLLNTQLQVFSAMLACKG